MSQCEPDGSRGFHGIKGSEIAIGPFAVHRRRPMFAVRRPMFGGAGLKTLLSKSSGVLRSTGEFRCQSLQRWQISKDLPALQA
jgi:hypothetical protein